MAARVANWVTSEQESRDRRAAKWRRARATLGGHEPAVRRALLDYRNGHRWLPGDPSHLFDLLHGFETGRHRIEDGWLRPASVVIPVSQAVAASGPPKPLSRTWFSKRLR